MPKEHCRICGSTRFKTSNNEFGLKTRKCPECGVQVGGYS
jgi:rubredoxin